MADEANAAPDRQTSDGVEALVRLGERYLTWPELCRRSGVEHEVGDRLWRALGFPDRPPDEPAFGDDDVRALAIAAEGLDELEPKQRAEALDLLVREARALGAYLSRISDVEVDALAELGRLGLRRRTISGAFEHGIERSDYGWLLLYALRRRLDEVLRRRATNQPGEQTDLAVGFIDLVDFTSTSAALDVEEFGRLLNRFEAIAWDVVTEAGGQVVKLIGDEAMLVCPSAEQAASAALDVITVCGHGNLPPARAGLAAGPLMARVGDYFGPAVNVASRLVDHADAGSVLVDATIRERLGDEAAAIPRSAGKRRLKGIGEIEVWRLEAAR